MEYIWEVEKYLFGSKIDEKNSPWMFWKKKSVKLKSDNVDFGDLRSVEDVMNGSDENLLDYHFSAKALYVLFNKIDR